MHPPQSANKNHCFDCAGHAIERRLPYCLQERGQQSPLFIYPTSLSKECKVVARETSPTSVTRLLINYLYLALLETDTPSSQCKIFRQSISQMFKFAILTISSVPSILAAVSREYMASALIAAEDTGTLGDTFKTFEKEQDHVDLYYALVDVAIVQAHTPKVAICLRIAHDPFPKDMSRVDLFVHRTLFEISDRTNTESFTNVITSFRPGDVKLLVSVRFWTLVREGCGGCFKKSTWTNILN